MVGEGRFLELRLDVPQTFGTGASLNQVLAGPVGRVAREEPLPPRPVHAVVLVVSALEAPEPVHVVVVVLIHTAPLLAALSLAHVCAPLLGPVPGRGRSVRVRVGAQTESPSGHFRKRIGPLPFYTNRLCPYDTRTRFTRRP